MTGSWCWQIFQTSNLTPELAIGLAGNIAQFNYKGNHVRTGEINAFSRWVPTHPKLKNLTVWAMFGPGWSLSYERKNAGAERWTLYPG